LCIFGRIFPHHTVLFYFLVSYDIIIIIFLYFSFLKNEKEYHPNAHPRGNSFFFQNFHFFLKTPISKCVFSSVNSTTFATLFWARNRKIPYQKLGRDEKKP